MNNYAVMWANTENLGDDIQTLAAINFLEKKGISSFSYINREKLSDYDGPPVKLIMNGWFMHDIHKFPPHNNISPIFISFHCANSKMIKNNISYFKKYEPIGCRDYNTVKLFNKYNIKSYFTGCLTLFFDEVKNKTNLEYTVDINRYHSSLVNLENYKNFKKIKHSCPPNINMIDNLHLRLEIAKHLLNLYRQAKTVLTSRLHCVLPCRAFNTEVKFVHRDYNTDKRFTGLTDYIEGNIEKINKIKKFYDEFKL